MTTLTASTSTSLECLPRFGTQRNYDRETLGPAVAEVALRLGKPFMPWQRHVADIAFEVEEVEGKRRLVYGEVDLTVPRQSGKTTLILPVAVHRAVARTSGIWTDGAQNVVYTAQTRNDARKKWEDDHVKALKASAFKSLFTVRLSNGAEAIKWKNGSLHGIGASTEKSGHGATVDLGFIDEAFSQIDTRQEQSMRPAMITRRSSQLWVVSTAGTVASTYLRGKVDKGRERVAAGVPSKVAYFEWSAPDDDSVDIADPAVWWDCMPALGITVDEESIRNELDGMTEDDFRRAFLNQWRDGKAPLQVIPVHDWALCADPGSDEARGSHVPDGLPIAVGIDMTPDYQWTSIGAAGRRADDADHIEVIAHRPGSAWVVDYLLNMRRRPVYVVIDPSSPAGSLIEEIEAAGFEVIKIGAREYAQACGSLFNVATQDADESVPGSRAVFHRNQPSLNSALAGAVKQALADAWKWSRKSATVISPIVAVTLARFGLAQIALTPRYDPLKSIY